MTRTYVIGHVNPDTDSIAAAMGYAWLLRERDGDDFVAARAGAHQPANHLGAQATWGWKPPLLLNDASPRFESVTRRLDTTAPEQPAARSLGDRQPHLGRCPGGQRRRQAPSAWSPARACLPSSASWSAPHPAPPGDSHRRDPGSALPGSLQHRMSRASRPAAASAMSLNRILREEGDDFLVVDDNGHVSWASAASEMCSTRRACV